MRSLLVLALLGAAPARAEMWAARMGELLHAATRVEVIHVGTVKGTTISGNIVEAIRSSTRPGAVVQIDLAGLVTPVVGDDVLLVCDSECPRAAGVADHGAFRLTARVLGDGALVTPDLVERASLVGLAAGAKVHDLCFAGRVTLLDDPEQLAFTASVSATDGTGTGVLDGKQVTASLGHPWASTGIELRLGAVSVLAPHLVRGPDGCFGAIATPIQPVARTRSAVAAALAGKPRGAKLATGAWTVPAGAPVSAGRHTVELALDADGGLMLSGDLAQGRAVELDRTHGHLALGFSTGKAFYPMLVLDFVETAEAIDSGAAVAAILAPSGATIEVALVTSEGKTLKHTSLGKLDLHYLPETPKGRR